MTHRSTAGSRIAKRVAVSFLASACLIAGSPVVASGAAPTTVGADKPVSATHGDCKHNNAGVHNGYDCPEAPVTGGSGGVVGLT